MSKIKSEYIHRFQVNPQHVDIYGHVNHAKYLELFEECRWKLIESSGYGPSEIQRLRIGPIILEAKIKYKKELRSGDPVEIHTWTEPFKKKVGFIHQKMFLTDTTLASEVDLVYGLMHIDQRTLVSPPEEWLKALHLA